MRIDRPEHAARARGGLGLLEAVIAIVILALVAAFTVPRLGRTAPPPDDSDAVREAVRILRVAIERYYQDHYDYPGATTDGTHDAGSAAAVITQLTCCTNRCGVAGEGPSAAYPCGPYLRDGVPRMPLCPGPAADQVAVVEVETKVGWRPECAAGWVYHRGTGRIAPNTPRTDAAGRPYAQY